MPVLAAVLDNLSPSLGPRVDREDWHESAHKKEKLRKERTNKGMKKNFKESQPVNDQALSSTIKLM